MAQETVRVQLATIDRPLFEDEGASVVVPGENGEIGFFPEHAAIVGPLGTGEVRIARPEGGTRFFFVSGGFFRVALNEVMILADEAVEAEAIDVAAAHEKLAETRRLPVRTDEEYAAAQAAARYAEARLRVAQRAGVVGP